MARIGFVGLGIMGHAMAANLIAAAHDTVVWNRTASKVDDLVASGGAAAETGGVAAEGDGAIGGQVDDREAGLERGRVVGEGRHRETQDE